MFTLKVAVILHGITLTGNLGSINYPYCDTIAKYLSGDNWVVSCTSSESTSFTVGTGALVHPSWTNIPTGCSAVNGNVLCR